ncbi:hypothetical protein C2S52_008117 [Perilla frutescens var. hirtella]|uniref:Uncharacterized protein n=1 Tax=Perilla frutescens var. hirtella TaxID=608512 RepID=A0AAD4ILP4_PERFH|nr:hypothetical protein C2S53_017895 [Perilla frutescens var. hirtella]KAH6783158.1 hypothetical protein C2S52_008117 [Perilla frutescens var. hirtella]
MFCLPLLPGWINFILHLQSLSDDHGWDLKEYEEASIPDRVWPTSMFDKETASGEFITRFRESRGIGEEKKTDDNKRKHDEIIGWPDEQPDSSVIFLYFGTNGCFDSNQLKEIALALENGGQRFLLSHPAMGGFVAAETTKKEMRQLIGPQE